MRYPRPSRYALDPSAPEHHRWVLAALLILTAAAIGCVLS